MQFGAAAARECTATMGRLPWWIMSVRDVRLVIVFALTGMHDRNDRTTIAVTNTVHSGCRDERERDIVGLQLHPVGST